MTPMDSGVARVRLIWCCGSIPHVSGNGAICPAPHAGPGQAKAVITDRLVLEAKRLLAHSLLPVAGIGDQLGFGEATNFVKFFRRETGLTPGDFRAEQRSRGARIRSS